MYKPQGKREYSEDGSPEEKQNLITGENHHQPGGEPQEAVRVAGDTEIGKDGLSDKNTGASGQGSPVTSLGDSTTDPS